jgi:hypothetical protein
MVGESMTLDIVQSNRIGNMRVYHPIPFEEYKYQGYDKGDTPERYEVIRSNYGSFAGKSLYDLCSANCYFGFKFLQDGGKEVACVDNDIPTCEFVNDLARQKNLSLYCYQSIGSINAPFDIGFYLETHYWSGTEGYIEHISKRCKVVYTSCYNDYDKNNNTAYEVLLRTLFNNVEVVFTPPIWYRTIYRCS